MRRFWILAASLLVAACSGGTDSGGADTTLGEAASTTLIEAITTTTDAPTATTSQVRPVGESSIDSRSS